MKRPRRLLLLALPLLLLAVAGGTAYRQAQRDRLERELLYAIRARDAKRVAAILRRGADPNGASRVPLWSFGQRVRARLRGRFLEEVPRYTPLTMAAEVGDVPTATMLLRHGARVDSPGSDYFSPLCAAVSQPDESAQRLALVRLLVLQGANPRGMECLGPAVDRRHLQTVRLLISAGAGPDGDQALARAAHGDWAEGVKELLRRGADPTMAANLFGVPGTPATYAHDPALRRLLRQAEADWRRKHAAAGGAHP